MVFMQRLAEVIADCAFIGGKHAARFEQDDVSGPHPAEQPVRIRTGEEGEQAL